MDDDLKKPAHDELMLWIGCHIADILMDVFSLPSKPELKTTKWERAIKSENGHIIGFVDMFVEATQRWNSWHVFIEAKTEIKSLGELIRQIRLYQAGGDFCFDAHWLVISPDNRFADTLRKQGILFYEAPLL